MSYDVSIREPVVIHDCPNCGGHEGDEVFEVNITYNVSTMLRRAGLHHEMLNGMSVKKARLVVHHAAQLMEDNRLYFSEFEASNGWGTYDTTLKAIVALERALNHADDDNVLRWV